MAKTEERKGRWALVRNPLAGRVGDVRLRRWLEPLTRAGFDFDDIPARSREATETIACDLARRSEYVGVLAAGGDGTANAVATGLLGSRLPMAVLPLGTANVLARELMGSIDPARFARLLRMDNIRALRPGLANGHPFLLMVSIGLDARAVSRIRPSVKRFGGAVAYGVSGLEALAGGLSAGCRLSVDGSPPQPVTWAVIARAALHAGGVALGSRRSLDFGGLRVLATNTRNRLTLTQILALRAAGRRHAEVREWEDVRVAELTGPSSEPVQMDGERWRSLPVIARPSAQTVRVYVSPERHRPD